MKKFRYRMENVLNIKLQLEEQQKIQFTIASNKVEEEKEKLKQMVVRQNMFQARLKEELSSDELNLMEVRLARDGIEYMKRVIREQMFAISKAEKALEIERKKLNDIRIERKTQEKLKEYAFEEYKREFAAEEAREIDQTVTYTYSTQNA
ncbi:MAG: flagellar FliJ family protein [Eubacterium sp.]|nr:flagellar FliJ family protein [Eubacterium sp.]